MQSRPRVARHARIHVHGARDFGEHHHRAPERRQQPKVRGHRVDFARDRSLEQSRTIPSRDQTKTMASQQGGKRVRVARKLVTELDADVAGGSRLVEALLYGRVASKLLEIVVRPRDGTHADSDRHSSPPRSSLPAAGTGTSHQAPPAWVDCSASVSITNTVVRPIERARTIASSSSFRPRHARMRAERTRVGYEIDHGTLVDQGFANDGAPTRRASRWMHPNPRLSATTIVIGRSSATLVAISEFIMR